MDLSDKIKQILSSKNITPSIFADEIGIQRSSMSHILAGRNKPSLDIIQKIVKRFPELGLNWILDGEDLPVMQPVDEKEIPRKALAPRVRAQSNPEPARVTPPQSKATIAEKVISEERKIERILVFFTDGSYKEYKEA